MNEVPYIDPSFAGLPKSVVCCLQMAGLTCLDLSQAYEQARFCVENLAAAVSRSGLFEAGSASTVCTGHVRDSFSDSVRYRSQVAAGYLDAMCGYVTALRRASAERHGGGRFDQERVHEALVAGSDVAQVTELVKPPRARRGQAVVPGSRAGRLWSQHQHAAEALQPLLNAAEHRGLQRLRDVVELDDELAEELLTALRPVQRYAETLHFTLALSERVLGVPHLDAIPVASGPPSCAY